MLLRTQSVDRIFVPSDALTLAAEERGITPDQITKHGLPIRKGFWADSGSTPVAKSAAGGFFDDLAKMFEGMGGGKNTAPSPSPPAAPETTKVETRTKLGLSDVPTVLIVGGGDGMGGIVPQARAVAARLTDASEEEGEAYQMVVVCGKNADARDTLRSVNWGDGDGNGGDGVEVRVEGFVNNMDEFMRASDVIVTKAGPGTIAEASICGLPCMLSSFL